MEGTVPTEDRDSRQLGQRKYAVRGSARSSRSLHRRRRKKGQKHSAIKDNKSMYNLTFSRKWK